MSWRTVRAIGPVAGILLLLSACTGSSSSGGDSGGPSASGPGPAGSTDMTVAAIDCGAGLVPMTEGPYYTPGAPERTRVADANTVGTPLVLSGVVVDADCMPVPGALLDFWQADGAGRYDNTGFSLRGVQGTGPDGRYRLVTVVPGVYPGRTEHIHVKVRPPGGPTYTTQLYFPGSANNEADGIFDPTMLVSVDAESGAGVEASFDVVLPSG